MKIERITPVQAAAWLGDRAANRRLSERRAERIADDIRAGRWKVNGDTVVFDKEGHLIDGQHRLRAIVLANAPVETYVVRGVEPDAFATIDSGRTRSNSDVLSILGKDKPTTLAAAVRYPWLHGAGLLNNMEAVKRLRPTRTEVVAAVNAHPFIEDALKTCASASDGILRHASYPGIYCIAAEANRALADAFFLALADGLRAKIGSPAFLLRQWIARQRTESPGRQPREYVIVHHLLIAWNAHALDRTLPTLGTEYVEDLPEMALPKATFAQIARLAR